MNKSFKLIMLEHAALSCVNTAVVLHVLINTTGSSQCHQNEDHCVINKSSLHRVAQRGLGGVWLGVGSDTQFLDDYAMTLLRLLNSD